MTARMRELTEQNMQEFVKEVEKEKFLYTVCADCTTWETCCLKKILCTLLPQ